MKRVFPALLLAVLLLASACAAKETDLSGSVVGSIPELMERINYNISLPTELPTGFLQTGMAIQNDRILCVCYSNGEQEILLYAADKDHDDSITDRIGKRESTLLEIDGHPIAFYPDEAENTEGEGLFIWSLGNTAYGLVNATPQEAAGMIYSMEPAATLATVSDLGRPEEEMATLETMEGFIGIRAPRPAALADGFTYNRCFLISGIIAGADFSNDSETLRWQASRSELVYTPALYDQSQSETLFAGTDRELTVQLFHAKGESSRPEARWEKDGVFYKVTCSGSPSREKMLTLVRELLTEPEA